MRKTWAKVGAASVAMGVLTLRLMQVGATGCTDTTRAGKEPTPPETPNAVNAAPPPSAIPESGPMPGAGAGDDSDDNPRFFPASKAAPMYYPQPKKPQPQAPQTPPIPQQGNAPSKTSSP